MVNEFEFIGITNQRDAAICLASIDKPIFMPSCKDAIILSELFFPLAYKDKFKLTSYAEDLWLAFELVKEENNISSGQILMKHFMDAVFYCLKRYGVYGKAIYQPTVEEWKQSIVESGFVISQI